MTQLISHAIQQPNDNKIPPPPKANLVADVSTYSYEAMAMAVGKKGKNFIKLTEQFGLAVIWHNKDKETLEIYGDYTNDSPVYSTVVQNIINMLALAEHTIATRGYGGSVEII